ncbi:hypothetical protein D3C71_1082600 [compost metagenome]
MVFRCDVSGDDKRLTAGVLDPFGGVGRIIVFVEIGDQNIGAFTRESNGHGLANPRICAGDQRDFAFESSIAAIRFLAMIRDWLHRPGFARRLLLLFGIRWQRAALFFSHDIPPVE